MENAKLPPGIEPAPAGASDRVIMAEPSADDPSRVTIESPTMTGMPVQVQHPTNHPAEATRDPGMLAGAVVQGPVGPLLCLQIRHADGKNLTAIMTAQEVEFWDEMWTEIRNRTRLLDAEPEGAS